MVTEMVIVRGVYRLTRIKKSIFSLYTNSGGNGDPDADEVIRI